MKTYRLTPPWIEEPAGDPDCPECRDLGFWCPGCREGAAEDAEERSRTAKIERRFGLIALLMLVPYALLLGLGR